ncbi:helicase-exonuclease AddAB subunit AddB [Anaerotignum sp.]|uniref:helicase-exonuclease AddAB subunit AddB n=1 Tax=Anaerotignum sp. TaxID=2039241 RepID=UPI0028A58ABD|nr:helicase-exonuclease AddAB subunit AddB [Anaerotignum sp.]
MALRFIIGTAGTGKTHLCMDEIIKKQSDGKGRQIFIVPEQFTSQTERDLITHSPQNAILLAEVLSFGRLAHQIFSKNGMGQKVPLGDMGKSMAIQKVLIEEKEHINFFKNAMDKTGFVDQLSLTISEFFQYYIEPQQLLEKATSPQITQGVKDKLTDLATIYQSYLSFLEKDYISGDETLALLATQLSTIDPFENTEIWLDGFYGFTPQEYTVIEKLLKLTFRVTVTLPMDEKSFFAPFLPPSAPFFEPYTAKNKLVRLAEENGLSIEPPVFLSENHRSKTEALKALEKFYFQGYYKKCSLKESVQIISCPTRQEEITFAAGNIIRLVREQGLRFKDMAIVTNAMDVYEKSLRGILREYNIPCFIDSRREISSHPLITMVTALLDCLVYDFRYESVFSYLKSGLTPFSNEEIDVLENYVLAYGIKGFKWQKDTWEYGIKKEGEETLHYMNLLRQRFMEPFVPFMKLKKKSKRPLSEFIALMIGHLDQLGVAKTLSDWTETSQKAGNPAKGEEHRQIWQLLMQVFEKAAEILGDEPLTLPEASKILSAGLQKCTMGVIPPTTDCLVVGDIERSRLPEIKYLFVLGVNEGVLPSPSQPQGIFTESERQLLTETGMELASDGKRKAFEEQFLIYRGLTRPSEGLFLTYANGETQGKALFPSPIIDRLCHMDNTLSVQLYSGITMEEMVPASAFHLLGEKMREHKKETPMDPLWKDIYSFFATEPLWEKRLFLLRKGFTTTKKQEQLSPKTAKSLYGEKIFSSVSRLERFAACPFSYFAEYGLKATERKLYQLHTPDLGLLFHEVLELFSNKVKLENIPWDTLTQEKTEELIHEAVDLAAPKLGDQILMDTAANQYLIHRLKRISSRAAWTLVRHLKNGDFTPEGYEIGFGNHEALPPIIIELAQGNQLVLSGKIDRVDLLDTQGNRYAKIIDYKSGSKSFNFQDIYYGLQLQLLIYLDAYLKHYEKTATPMKPGGVFYFRITDPNISLSQEMSPEEIEEALYQKMQMSGLILEDETVIQGLDHIFVDEVKGKASAIVPVGYTKKGEPSATAYLADESQYEKLLSFVVNRAAELGDSMQKGTITPAPYRKSDQSPCAYCRFKSICRYDYDDEPKWRDLKKVSKKDFWDMIEEK